MKTIDLIQMLSKEKLTDFLLEFALKCQAEDEKFFDMGIVRYEKIERWLSSDINDKPKTWEKEYISVLDITPSAYEALYYAGIRTLGDLSKYRVYDLKQIPRIGEKGVTQILEEFESFTGVKINP